MVRRRRRLYARDPERSLGRSALAREPSAGCSQSFGETNMAQPSVNNGVNVQALLDAREALRNAPAAAEFTWRASCKWQNGTHAHSTVRGFRGLGEEQAHKTEFSFETDHPEIFASEDHGATPVELVLVGLASCLTAGV